MSRAPVTIYPLPPSAEALLIPQAHLRIGVGKAYRDDRLSQIRRDAAKYPGDPFALAVLAEAELEIGDAKTGVGLLDSLLANDPQNAGLLTVRGLAALRAQDVVTGRRFLGRSYKLNPNDATTLFYYGRSFAGQEAVPSENTLNVLMRAADLAPQVSGINLTVAAEFMKARQFADAIRLLMPIASNPHGGGAADVAR